MLLYFIALILFKPLQVVNFLLVLWVYRNKNSFLSNVDGFFKQSALDLDRYGNRTLRTLWNHAIITKDGYQFGNEKETISSALGKNQLKNTTTFLGKVLIWILDKIEKGHCIKSINYFYE